MAVPKSSYTRALPVYASDNAFLANPALLIISNVARENPGEPNQLVTDFSIEGLGIRAGDIVINLATGQSATSVGEPFGGNLLNLNANLPFTTNQPFAIYQGDQNSASKAGCVLYASESGGCDVLTLGGDKISLNGLIPGTIIPLQVIKVFETDYNTNLISLW
jgi:hypothetical protein